MDSFRVSNKALKMGSFRVKFSRDTNGKRWTSRKQENGSSEGKSKRRLER